MVKFAGLTAAAAGLMALAGCGDGGTEAGGVTAEESRELDNAAEMLDASPDSLTASEDAALGNGESAETGDVLVADTPADANAAGGNGQ